MARAGGGRLPDVVAGDRFLYLLVFVVGTASLGAEIAAARLMAPFFGASTIVWANTIGVVLVALSIGYWLGGRLGDRYPGLRELCLVICLAAILLAVVPFAARPFFELSVDALDEISAGAFVGSLVGVLFLIAIPVVLLGTAYWGGLVDWLRSTVLAEGKIKEVDLALFSVTDDPVEAVRLVHQAESEWQVAAAEEEAARSAAADRAEAGASGGPEHRRTR